MQSFDVLIIGAGAAGMMCAIEAGKRGRRVLLLDHAEKPAEKIRISGGGRCNFTNLHCGPGNFVSQNPHFAKSALARFTQHDFVKLVEKHGIAYHEKTLGQLFCDGSSKQIINMLLAEMLGAGVRLTLETKVASLQKKDGGYLIETSKGPISASAVVIATGGLSIPKMGATGFGYGIARQFGLGLVETRPALVPLLFDAALLELTRPLSGLSVDPAIVSHGDTEFREALLFTHRGLSGPSILQISTYWREGDDIIVDLFPGGDTLSDLKRLRQEGSRQLLSNALARYVPQRLADLIARVSGHNQPLADMSDAKLQAASELLSRWRVRPIGTEGYRTAEVTRGGVDTDAISSKTFETKDLPGLYFIGEVLDVTGHLGGHNFQWAWASGWCAGQFV